MIKTNMMVVEVNRESLGTSPDQSSVTRAQTASASAGDRLLEIIREGRSKFREGVENALDAINNSRITHYPQRNGLKTQHQALR